MFVLFVYLNFPQFVSKLKRVCSQIGDQIVYSTSFPILSCSLPTKHHMNCLRAWLDKDFEQRTRRLDRHLPARRHRQSFLPFFRGDRLSPELLLAPLYICFSSPRIFNILSNCITSTLMLTIDSFFLLLRVFIYFCLYIFAISLYRIYILTSSCFLCRYW